MERSTKPKYRAIVKFERIPNTLTNSNVMIGWNSEFDGRPSDKSAQKWLEVYNANLLPGGSNYHLTERGMGQKAIYVRVETNENYPDVLGEYHE